MSAFLRRALVLAAVTAGVVPAVADAAVTRSTVTSPANPTYLLDDDPPAVAGQAVEIVATTDGAQGDKVELVCTHGILSGIAKNVPVEADGTARVEVDVGQFPYQACDLRAVPVGFRGPDYGPFAGPTVAVSAYEPVADGAEVPIHNSGATAVLDYWVRTGHHRAVTHIRSAGSGALVDVTGVLAESHAPVQYATWSEGGSLFAPAIEVDGRTAYNAGGIPLLDFDGPEGREGITAPRGTEGVRSTFALDEATGVVTVGESQRIFRCAGTDSADPTADNCATVLDTGIRHERTITLTREHSIADVRDRWVSTDGSPHQLRVEYTAAGVKSPVPLWRFPSDPAFRAYKDGAVVVPQGPGTLLVRDGAKLAEASRGPGALSYAPAPAFVAFGRDDAPEEILDLAVPAGGAAPVRRVYAVGGDVAEAEALGRAAEDSFDAPRLALSSPSDGTTTKAASSTVGGRATDNVGIAALSVNGRSAPVSADGSFSVPVALAGGANEIVATATDGAGLTATARVVVHRVLERCRVPKVKPGSTLRTARRALAKAGCKAPKRARKARSRKVRKGRVIGLTRKAGTVLPLRTTVGIRVSRGRR